MLGFIKSLYDKAKSLVVNTCKKVYGIFSDAVHYVLKQDVLTAVALTFGAIAIGAIIVATLPVTWLAAGVFSLGTVLITGYICTASDIVSSATKSQKPVDRKAANLKLVS